MGLVRFLLRGAACLCVAAVAALGGCSDIWGFEDAIEETESGSDATTSPGSSGGQVTFGDGRAEDASQGDAALDQDATQSHSDANTGDARGSMDANGASDAGSADAAQESVVTCASRCVPAPSAGWQGPLALFQGSGLPLPSLPSCPEGYTNHVFDGFWALDAGPTACTCGCGPVQDASCGQPTMALFSDPNCTMSCPQASQVVGATCTTLNLTNCGGTHFIIEAGAPSGTCAPDASSTVPAPVWEGNVRVCALSSPAYSSGCLAGQMCAPSPGLPFEFSCIAQPGLWTCPSGYPVQHTYYDGTYSDSRGCTACSCGAPSLSCAAGVLTYSSPSCGGGSTSFTALDTCTSLGAPHTAIADAGTPSGGTCAASGGVPSGSLSPSTPMTVCCTQ